VPNGKNKSKRRICSVYNYNPKQSPLSIIHRFPRIIRETNDARQVRVKQDDHTKAKDLDTQLGGDQQDGFDTELRTFGRNGVVLGPIVGAFGEMSSHADLLADLIADALTAEHLSYY